MEFDFTDEQVNLILKGLDNLNTDEAKSLAENIKYTFNAKTESNYKMLEDDYGHRREFRIVDVDSDEVSDGNWEESTGWEDDDGNNYYVLTDMCDGGEIAVDYDDYEEKYYN